MRTNAGEEHRTAKRDHQLHAERGVAIEGTRRENDNAAPEHSIRLDLNIAW